MKSNETRKWEILSGKFYDDEIANAIIIIICVCCNANNRLKKDSTLFVLELINSVRTRSALYPRQNVSARRLPRETIP